MDFKLLAASLRDDIFRASFKQDVVQNAVAHLNTAFEKLKDSKERNILSVDVIHSIQWPMECFRNACVNCEKNQLLILKQPDVLETALGILQLDSHLEDQGLSLAFSMTKTVSLQFIGNLVAANSTCQVHVWNRIFPDLTRLFMERISAPHKNILCMVIYNCILESPEVYGTKEFSLLLAQIIDFSQNFDTEWGLLILQHAVSSKGFPDLYDQLAGQHKQRLVLLDLLHACISDGTNAVPQHTIAFMAKQFKGYLNVIVFGKESQMETFEQLVELVLLLLQILCDATSHPKYIDTCTDEGLVDCAISYLKHLSKFKTDTRNSKEPHRDGTFGVKRDIVRLIGNLCFKNKANQDQVRALDGIHNVLDSCKIDDENPYIAQWAVFAIRNLCENNPENQNVILQLERQGLANTEDIEKLGINVKIVDGKVTIGSKDHKPGNVY
ncbi:ataxin-10-like isoform X2 [Rhopilema esculentum]|uniref:ataxin-10-like isoform X2 n=1 Tax=Rhopilema esculentum TaxID=499914 RepID=UPI0031D67B3B